MILFRIDMSLTDEKVLQVLRQTLGNKPGKLTLNTIAAKVGCSRPTAFRAIRRLETAGRLTSRWQGQSKPCIYQVLDD